MGFKFYGFGAEAARVAHDVSVAASQRHLKSSGETPSLSNAAT
jgi:hypothetical protein